MRGGQVLELVDEQVAMLGLDPAAEVTVAKQRLERPVDLLVEVDGPDSVEPLAKAIETVRQAGDVVAHLLHLGRIGEPEADDRERVEVGADRIGVGLALARDREDLVDQPPGVGLAQHPRPVAAVAGEQRVAERVQRPASAAPSASRRVSSSFWASLL